MKPTNTHQHLAYVFSGEGHNQRLFPRQMTLNSLVFIGTSSDGLVEISEVNTFPSVSTQAVLGHRSESLT